MDFATEWDICLCMLCVSERILMCFNGKIGEKGYEKLTTS